MLRITSLTLMLFVSLSMYGQAATPNRAFLMQQAKAAYQGKHYSKSASLYERVLPLAHEESTRTHVEHDLARAQAMAGDRSVAFKTLDRAVEDGYIDRNAIETDPGLISLHAAPRWEALLDRISQAAAAQNARWGDAALATPYTANISNVDKIAGLSELWAQAKYGFANFWHVPQLNWDQTYLNYIPKVLATHSTCKYYRVLQRFYALLKDGHSGVFPPRECRDKLNILFLRTRLVDGHVLIVGFRNSTFNRQGLHAGDEIVTINSQPATVWAEHHVTPFISASSSQSLDFQVYDRNLFVAPEGTAFTLGIETPTGKKSTHVFVVRDNYWRGTPFFKLKFLPGNIAYIALNSFENDTDAKEWDKHWPEISKAKALILDLRKNEGGNGSVGNHILATLIDKPVAGELGHATRWIPTYRAWERAEIPLQLPMSLNMLEPDSTRHFSGPVVLLIGPSTFSAAEDFTVSFAQAHRGEIIGEPTAGSTGQPLSFKLPGGGGARICTLHESFADGRQFIGVGIQPNILAHQTRADVIAGRDAALERAVHLLRTRRH